jgi:hypothetical protein
MDGERAEQLELARVRDEVIGALTERVEVETVEEQIHGIVLVRIRLPKGLTEQLRLATEEWVQLQLIGLEGAHTREAIVYVPRYI